MQTEPHAFPLDDDEEQRPRSSGPDPYLAFALRWWWLMVLGVVIGTVGGLLYIKLGPLPYQSVAQVQVPPQTTNNPTANSVQAREAAVNYAAEAITSQMFTLVSQELSDQGVDLSPSDLSLMLQNGDLVIRETKNTNFINISVNDPSPKRARLIADTFAVVLVRDVNSRASAQIDSRQQELSKQIDFTRQQLITAQLNQRAEDLRQRLAAQRNVLLQLQTSYQQELQRQQEADRLNGTNQQSTPQLASTRAQWLDLINAQIKDQQKVIQDVTDQLTQVQAQLAQLPSSADPSVSAAFASAYSLQLQQLTQQFVQLQLDAVTGRTPLVRYGEASDPLPSSGRKKMLLMGVALGGVLAAALGFGIDILRRRRSTAQEATEVEEVVVQEPRSLPRPVVVEEPVAATAQANPPDDLLIMIERARQRRSGHDQATSAVPGTTEAQGSETTPRRPLPTQEPRLRRLGS